MSAMILAVLSAAFLGAFLWTLELTSVTRETPEGPRQGRILLGNWSWLVVGAILAYLAWRWW